MAFNLNMFVNLEWLTSKLGLIEIMDSIYNIIQNYIYSPLYQPPKLETPTNFHLGIAHPVLHCSPCFLPPFQCLISSLYSYKIGSAKDSPVKPYRHTKISLFRTVKPLEVQPVVKSP